MEGMQNHHHAIRLHMMRCKHAWCCPSKPHPSPPSQANKNVMVKGHVSLQGVAVAGVIKSWWQPSFTLAGAATLDFATGRTRYGLTAAVETFKNIRWVSLPDVHLAYCALVLPVVCV